MFGHDFPYLDTRDINLDWLLKNMKTLVQDWTTYQLSMNQQFSNLTEAFNTLKAWVESYFENLDVSAEIEQKLDRMAVSGELGFIMRPIISGEVSDWLAEHITQPTDPAIDTSLTVAGAAADAKATGDLINSNTKSISDSINMIFDDLEAKIQFIDNTDKTTGHRWNLSSSGILTMPESTGYSAFSKIVGCKAGSYTYNAVYDAFTILENQSTGQLSKLSDLSGQNLTLTAGGRTVTIGYDFNLYCTRSDAEAWTGTNTVFCNASLPATYAYGIYESLLKNYAVKANDNYIISSNYASLLPDLDTAEANTAYTLVFSNGSTDIPAHYPFDSYKGTVNLFVTFKGQQALSRTQLMFSENFICFRRMTGESTFGSWAKLSTIEEVNEIRTDISIVNKNIDAVINTFGGLFQYADKDDTESGHYWNLSSGGVLSKPAASGYSAFNKVYNLPAGSYTYNAVYDVFTILENAETGVMSKLSDLSGSNNTLIAGGRTVTIAYDFNIYMTRSENGAWATTPTLFCNGKLPDSYVYGIYNSKLSTPTPFIVDQSGNGDFTTLKAGLEEAVKHPNSLLYVNAGTYDLLTEFGADYFAGLDGSDDRAGLQLGNGVHVIFSSDAKVTCMYTGDNTNVNKYFSPFNAKTGSFILENLTCEAENVRYIVHDEHTTNTNRYKSHYKNCRMKIDNSDNPVWNNAQCIGGGLGTNGEIIVEDSYFYGEGSTRQDGVVSYHNCGSAGAKSRIVVKGCYFAGSDSTVRFGYYGASTEVTDCYVHGNSFSAEPLLRAENASAVNVNMEMFAYCNEVRI